MEDIVMPLHEYINHPVAMDIVHNGATFQVAGLTNNSNIREAHELRQCVIAHPILGKYVLEVAKKRLDDMLYVGITEDHRESATMFANVVGAQVISQLMASTVNNNASEQGPSFSDLSNDTTDDQDTSSSTAEEKSENMTVGKLMKTYDTCISSLRSSQSQRRIASLKRISPANFTKEYAAPLHLPSATLSEDEKMAALGLSDQLPSAQGLLQAQLPFSFFRLICWLRLVNHPAFCQKYDLEAWFPNRQDFGSGGGGGGACSEITSVSNSIVLSTLES